LPALAYFIGVKLRLKNTARSVKGRRNKDNRKTIRFAGGLFWLKRVDAGLNISMTN